jgi:hypothetical protein
MPDWKKFHDPTTRRSLVESHRVVAACGSTELRDDGICEVQTSGIAQRCSHHRILVHP